MKQTPRPSALVAGLLSATVSGTAAADNPLVVI